MCKTYLSAKDLKKRPPPVFFVSFAPRDCLLMGKKNRLKDEHGVKKINSATSHHSVWLTTATINLHIVPLFSCARLIIGGCWSTNHGFCGRKICWLWSLLASPLKDWGMWLWGRIVATDDVTRVWLDRKDGTNDMKRNHTMYEKMPIEQKSNAWWTELWKL